MFENHGNVFRQKPDFNKFRFVDCRFEDITAASGGSSGITISSSDISLEVESCSFERLVYQTVENGAAALYGSNIGSSRLLFVCMYNCRHPYHSQSFGLDSHGYNCMSTEVNLSLADEGDDPHQSGSSTHPFYAGGINHFIFQQNNVTSRKEFVCGIFVSLLRCDVPGVVASFSQFVTGKTSYLLDICISVDGTTWSHCNVIDFEVSGGLFYNTGFKQKLRIENFVFVNINLPTSSGTANVDLISSFLSFPQAQLPSGCICTDCAFDFDGIFSNQPVVRFDGRCDRSSFDFTAIDLIGQGILQLNILFFPITIL